MDLPSPPAETPKLLLSEPTIHPRKPVPIRHGENVKLFLVLSAGTYAAATLDMHETMALRNGGSHFEEEDPLARPFTRLPTPAYYAVGFALATGVSWLSYRMARSERWHRIWWLPQTCAMGGNLFGFAYSRTSR